MISKYSSGKVIVCFFKASCWMAEIKIEK